jgi:hypothetical protein
MCTNLSVTSAADFLKDGEPVVSGVNRKFRAICVIPFYTEISQFTKAQAVRLRHTMVHCPDMQRKTFACFLNAPKEGLK